jgi:hypothetical protein
VAGQPQSLDEFIRDFRLKRVGGGHFERPKLALSNLLRFDIPGAARGLVAPETLSPVQRQTLADRWGVGDGVFGKVLRVAENPLALLGAILAIKFRVPLSKNLFEFTPKLEGLLRNPGFIRMRVTGNFDAIYHGLKAGDSTLPEVFKALGRDIQGFRNYHLTRVGTVIQKFEGNSGVDFGERMGIALVRRLEGKPLKSMGGQIQPHFETMATEVRGSFDQMYKQVIGAADSAALLQALAELKLPKHKYLAAIRSRAAKSVSAADKEILEAVAGKTRASKRALLEQLRNEGFITGGIEGAAKKPNYWPHRSLATAADYDAESARLVASGAGGETVFGKRMLAAAESVSTPHALKRMHRMVANPADLKKIQDLLPDPKEISMLEGRMRASPDLRPYSMNFLQTFEGYTHSLAKAYGWTVRGRGRAIVQAAESLEQSYLANPKKYAHNKIRAAMLRDSYVPLAMGRSTYRQGLASAQFDEMKYRLAQQLNKSGLQKALGADTTNWLRQRLVEDRGILNFRNLQGRIAGHFYVGALGMNVTSSAYNLMQTLLTTVPVIGPTATAQGLSKVLQKVPQYFRHRQAGMGSEIAMAKTFPEFGAEGLTGSPLTTEAMGGLLSKAWEESAVRRPNVVKGAYDRVSAALMSLFQSSERLVRLTAFEGTMAKAAAEGLTVEQAAPIARRVVETTQFLAGPHAVPSALKGLGPMLRQFGTFPMRYTDFLFGTSTEIGSAAQRGGLMGLMPDKNLGVLGRAMLTGGLAYEGAKEFLNQDVSRGLMFGALPVPSPDQPFAPMPYVPPILALGGAAAMDVLGGEFKHLQFQLPILAPGGVAAARFTTALMPGLAEKIGREHVAYDLKVKGKDGKTRVPIFSRGGSLRGYLTPFEVYLDGLGWPPGGVGSLQAERELEQYLLAQRDRIRTYRKEFLEALVLKNDIKEATRINEEYKEVYPGFGGIQVRPQDLQAVKMRYMVARLEKALETLPKEVRPFFGELVSTVMLQEAENLLGVDPYLLQAPAATVASRDVHRQPPPGSTLEAIVRRQIQRRQRVDPAANRFRYQNPLRTGAGRLQRAQRDLGVGAALTPAETFAGF